MNIGRRELVVLMIVCLVFVCLGSCVLSAPWVKYAPPGAAQRLFKLALGRDLIWFLEWCGDLYALDNQGQWRAWSLSGITPHGMAVDREGRVWFAALSGVFYLEGQGSPGIQPLFYPDEYWLAVCVDAEGWLWASCMFEPSATEIMCRKDITGAEWNAPFWDMSVSDFSPYGWDPAKAIVGTSDHVWALGCLSAWRWPLSGGSPEGGPLPAYMYELYDPRGIAMSRDCVWEVGSPLWGAPPPQEGSDIMQSPDGREWTPVAHPSILGKTGSTLCVTAVSDRGLWFGCGSKYPDPFQTGGGAFWYDYMNWRWFDLNGSAVHDIAVDEATGDVWFATSHGAYVLRGGPDAWPPVWIELTAQEPATKAGKAASRVRVEANVWFQMDLKLDIYVAVQDAMGILYFAPGFGPTMAPMAAGVEVPIGLTLEDFTVLTLDLANIPEGTYRWYAACTNAGTTNFASNIASCEWQFVK